MVMAAIRHIIVSFPPLLPIVAVKQIKSERMLPRQNLFTWGTDEISTSAAVTRLALRTYNTSSKPLKWHIPPLPLSGTVCSKCKRTEHTVPLVLFPLLSLPVWVM